MGHKHSKQNTAKANDKTNDLKVRNEELKNKTSIQKNVSDSHAKDQDNKNIICSDEMEELLVSSKSIFKVKQFEADDITKPMQETNPNENDVSLQESRKMTADRSRHLSRSYDGGSGYFLDLEWAKGYLKPNLVLGDETGKTKKSSTTETTKIEKERKEDLFKCSVSESETKSESSKIMSKGIEYDEKFVGMCRQCSENEIKKSREIITFDKELVLRYLKISVFLTVALLNSDTLQAITAKPAFRDHEVCAFNMSQKTENVLRHFFKQKIFPDGEMLIKRSYSKSITWKDTLLNQTHFQRIQEDVLSFAVGDHVNFQMELSRWRRSGHIRSILNNEILRRIHLKSEAFRLATFDLHVFDYEFEPGKTMMLALKGFYCDLDGRIRCYQCSQEYNGMHLGGQTAHCQNSTEHRRNSIAESYGRFSTGYLLGQSHVGELPIIDLHNRPLATSRHERQMIRQLLSLGNGQTFSRTVTSVPNDDNGGCNIPSPRNTTDPRRNCLSTENANNQVQSSTDLSRPTQPEERHQDICHCWGHVAAMDDPMNEMLLQFSSRQTNNRSSHSLRYNQQIDSHNPSSSAVNDDPTSRLVHRNACHQLDADKTSQSTPTFSEQKLDNQSQTLSDIAEFRNVSETVRYVADENKDDEEGLSSSYHEHLPEWEGGHGLARNSNVVPGGSLVGHTDSQQLYSERTSEFPSATDAGYSNLTGRITEIGDTNVNAETMQGSSILRVGTTSTEGNIQQGHELSTQEFLDSMESLAGGFASLAIGEESTRRQEENMTDSATQKQ